MSRARIQMTLEVFESSCKPLVAVLENISVEQLNWKAGPESRSIGEICRHLVRVDAWFLRRLGISPVVSDAKSGTREELAENMQRVQQQVKEVVTACASDEELHLERTSLDGKDKEKLGVAVIHMAQHYLYHLAQIIYLRRTQDREWPSPHNDWDAATHVIGDYLLGIKN